MNIYVSQYKTLPVKRRNLVTYQFHTYQSKKTCNGFYLTYFEIKIHITELCSNIRLRSIVVIIVVVVVAD